MQVTRGEVSELKMHVVPKAISFDAHQTCAGEAGVLAARFQQRLRFQDRAMAVMHLCLVR
jgi:hypothetical protein